MSRQNDKAQHERLQIIIAELLKDEENKYCADCDAKGPRWASWNLGVLLCIRCAGIHRGLGVHISKVKSLNLDTWELQQVAMLKAVGNRRARQLYEANLPEFFRRPQTDSALEQFIRAKYEQRRYVPSDFVPPQADLESVKKELLRLEQLSRRKTLSSRSINLPIQNAEPPKTQGRTLKSIAKNATANSGKGGTDDILGLSTPAASGSAEDELSTHSKASEKVAEALPTAETPKKEPTGLFSADLLGLSLGEVAQPSQGGATGEIPVSGSDVKRLATKESILALYALSKPSVSPATIATSVPSAVGGGGGLMFSPPLMQPNGQNGNAGPSMLNVYTSASQIPVQPPPMYQPPVHQPSNSFNWGSIQATPPQQQQVPKTPASVDLFNVDVFQGAAPKPATQWENAFPSGTSQPQSESAASTFQSQEQWPPSAFQSAPVAAAPNLNSSAQQSYLAQIQNQLASMQLRSGTVE